MIGIFDSGYGGMTVFKPILEALPEYDYIYLGDNARTPYGHHSEENITLFTEQAVNYLFNRGVKLIIFACNTASAVALRTLQQKYLNGDKETERKILGVVRPVAEVAAESKNLRIGVVGTAATIESKSYEEEIAKLNPKAKVSGKACPLLVPFIEENWHRKPEAKSILKKYLRPIKCNNLDTLILGCTHYPLMKADFKRYMGRKVRILDSGPITAKKLVDYLQRHPEIESKLSRNGRREFLTTGDPTRFQNFIQKHFGMKIARAKKIQLS